MIVPCVVTEPSVKKVVEQNKKKLSQKIMASRRMDNAVASDATLAGFLKRLRNARH